MKIKQIKRSASDFQQSLDESVLRETLAQQLPGETVREVSELAGGMFNNTFTVSTAKSDYVLKVAPGPDAPVFYNERLLMQRERNIAPQLESLSELIPAYLSFFTLEGRDAFLQPRIEGRLWHDDEQTLSAPENDRLWQQLGEFAATLHSCSGEQGQLFGYPAPCRGFRRWSEFIIDNVEGMVTDADRLGLGCEEVDAYTGRLPTFSGLLDEVEVPSLLHGDLWPRNVLYVGGGEDIHITAVIDAERAFWGDPISDWVLLFYDLPEGFWQGYGENLQETSDRLRKEIYKGMYLILNLLETTRFDAPVEPIREQLAAVNGCLESDSVG